MIIRNGDFIIGESSFQWLTTIKYRFLDEDAYAVLTLQSEAECLRLCEIDVDCKSVSVYR